MEFLKKNKKFIMISAAVLVLIAVIVIICVCSGGNDVTDPSDPTDNTGGSGTSVYTVTVVDNFGNPVSDGVIVNFMTGDTVTAMQTVDANGIASKELTAGTYTISLSFTQIESGYDYDASSFVNESNPNVTIVLTNYIPSKELYTGEKTHTAYYLQAGTNAVTVSTQERAYFLFTPTQTGVYEFSVSGDAVIGYYGSPFFVQSDSLAEVTDGKFTISFSSGMVGSDASTVIVLGVDSTVANVSITIERIGDAEKTLEDYDWTVYQTTASLNPYTLPADMTIVDFDLTAAGWQLIFNDSDGYYHLNTAEGPLVYCKLGVASAYMDSIEKVLESSGVSCYFFDAEGNFVKKETYNECLLEYIACMDAETGLYPLTQDLYYIIHQRGDYVGWWDPASPSYLYTDDNGNSIIGLNHEIAWLSFCCYGEPESSQNIPTEPQPTEPEPTEPEPTEPEPTEPAPTEPEPTEPEPTEPAFQLGTQSSADTVEVFYYQIADTMAFDAAVQAGEYANYDLYRMFNMMLTIESDTAYIVFNGEVYLPENGVLTFVLKYGSNNVSSPCSLAIGNSGNADQTFEVKLSTLPGTHENPVQLQLGRFTTTTTDGAYQGYYYTFTAEKAGTLTISFESIDIDKDCQITLYNLSTYQQNLETNSSVSITASAGDKIQIIIAVLDDKYEYPSATIVATATFE